MPRQVIEQTELAQLRALLQAQTRLRELAEEGYAEVLSILWRIARAALPEELDQELRADPQFQEAAPKVVGDWIVERLTAKHHRLRLLGRDDLSERLEMALRRAAEMEARAATLQQERDDLQRQVRELLTVRSQLAARDAQVAQLQQQLDTLRREAMQRREQLPEAELPEGQRPEPHPERCPEPFDWAQDVPVEGLIEGQRPELIEGPDWPAEWRRSHHFELDGALIRVMGDTGYCLRTTLVMALYREGHLASSDPSSGTATRLFRRVKEWGLVEGETQRTGASGGRRLEVVRLTERGKEAYRLLCPGQEAQEPEYDRLLARWESPEQALLILQARDALLAHGAQTVDLDPRPQVISGESTFSPDIVAMVGGKPIYVECEGGGPREGQVRQRKWGDYATVTREFHIMVPNGRVQSDLISEITRWSMDTGTEVTLCICNLAKQKLEGPLWTYERHLSW